ncbi:YggT family protein [Levilactobacillus namurensis]|uniref:YggT family protein n=1 Tax=Levilactobacillus namurensis TaxID=380393 RepID=A0AAW8W6H0_9LACO|nr:YggT family protein [Levilactobacillus namurensis]MDT7014772.1 YggT family protein [Levilactobacillus namurensis]
MLSLVGVIFKVLNWCISAYILLIVVYALMSWLPGAYRSRLGQFVGRIVNPFLSYFDRIALGPLGFGPVVAIVVLTLVQYGLYALEGMLINLMLS